MQTRIEFTRGGSNSILGNFAPGDIFRAPAALARHLVEEVRVARYLETPTESGSKKPRKRARK